MEFGNFSQKSVTYSSNWICLNIVFHFFKSFLTSLFSIFQSSLHFDLLLHLYPVWIFSIVVQLTKAKLCLMRLTFGCKKERTCSQTCSSSLFNWGRWRLSTTVNFPFCTRNFCFHFYSFPFFDIIFCFCFYCLPLPFFAFIFHFHFSTLELTFLLLLGCWRLEKREQPH